MPLFSKKRAISESPCRQQSSIPIPSSQPTTSAAKNPGNNRSTPMFFKINTKNSDKPSNNKITVSVGGNTSVGVAVPVVAQTPSIIIDSGKESGPDNEVN